MKLTYITLLTFSLMILLTACAQTSASAEVERIATATSQTPATPTAAMMAETPTAMAQQPVKPASTPADMASISGDASQESDMQSMPQTVAAQPTAKQAQLLASLPIIGTPPELHNEVWLNSAPLKLADLHGKVVIVEFWTYG